MYALGHLAIGYFAASSIEKIKGNLQKILIVWFFSLLHDIDILLPFTSHRGATHSLVAISILMIASLFRR